MKIEKSQWCSYSATLSSSSLLRIFRHKFFSSLTQPPMATTSEDSLRLALVEKQSTIDARGNSIRQLKSSGASKSDIDEAVKALNALKLEKTTIENQLKASISGTDNGSVISRDAFRQAVVNTLERRLFYIQIRILPDVNLNLKKEESNE